MRKGQVKLEGLPHHADGIFCDVFIRRENDEAVDNRLANEDAVKGVGMNRGEFRQLKDRFLVQWETHDTVHVPPLRNVFGWGLGQREASSC